MTDLSIIRNLSPWGVQLFALNAYHNRPPEQDKVDELQNAEDEESVLQAISLGINRTEAIMAHTTIPLCRVKTALTRMRANKVVGYHGYQRTWRVL